MTGRADREPKVLVLVCKAQTKQVFIMANDDGTVRGFTDERQARNCWRRSYDAAHARSYEGSMSACIHFMFFQPRIVRFKDLQDIKDRIASDPPRLVQLSHNSGFMKAITCRKEAYAIWKAAEPVPLISDRG